MSKRLSWIIPIYNEERVLPELWDRISPQLRALEAYDIQVIPMDGDLQDQPELIPQFIEAWERGSEVVYAVRKSRKENRLKRGLFWLFYKMLTAMSGIAQPLNAGVFGLMDRKVLDVLKGMPEHNRYFPGLRAYAGFRQTGIEIDRGQRYDDQPRLGLRGRFNLAFDALCSFSYLPIGFVTITGLFIALCAFLYTVVVLYHKLFSGRTITGWAVPFMSFGSG